MYIYKRTRTLITNPCIQWKCTTIRFLYIHKVKWRIGYIWNLFQFYLNRLTMESKESDVHLSNKIYCDKCEKNYVFYMNSPALKYCNKRSIMFQVDYCYKTTKHISLLTKKPKEKINFCSMFAWGFNVATLTLYAAKNTFFTSYIIRQYSILSWSHRIKKSSSKITNDGRIWLQKIIIPR